MIRFLTCMVISGSLLDLIGTFGEPKVNISNNFQNIRKNLKIKTENIYAQPVFDKIDFIISL